MTREEAISAIQSNRPTSGYTMLCEALDMAVAALRDQEERGWIPVSERLPEKGQKVVFFNYGYDAVYAGKFNYVGKKGTVWFRAGKTSYPGSCWMPLPEPPVEGS